MPWYIKSYEFFETVQSHRQSKRPRVGPRSGSPSSPDDGSDSGSDPAQPPSPSSPGHTYESSDEDEPRIRSPPRYQNRYDPSGSKPYPYDWPVSEDSQHMRKCYFDHYDLRQETNDFKQATSNQFKEVWLAIQRLNLGDHPSTSTVPEHTMGGQSYGYSMPEHMMGGQSFGSSMPGSMFGAQPYCYAEHGTSGTYSGYSQYPTQPAIMNIPTSSYTTPIPFATSGDMLFGTYVPHTEQTSLPYELTPIPFNMPYSDSSQVGPSFDATSASNTPAVTPPIKGKRLPRPSQYVRQSFTRQPATTPITARPNARTRGVPLSEDFSWHVIAQRYELDDLPENELPFYSLPVDKSWWGTMLGFEDSGYYTGAHFNAWMHFLMQFRPSDANWTIVDGEFSRHMSSSVRFP